MSDRFEEAIGRFHRIASAAVLETGSIDKTDWVSALGRFIEEAGEGEIDALRNAGLDEVTIALFRVLTDIENRKLH